MSNLLFLFLALFIGASAESVGSQAIPFSGFYTIDPKQSSEDFSAAWLVSRERFIQCEGTIAGARSVAGVSFGVVRYTKNRNFRTLLTRDYFDFFVEHMSATSNQIPFGNKQIFNETWKKVDATGNKLKEMTEKTKVKRDSRLDETLAVLVYSTNSFSAYKTNEQAVSRMYFFKTTYWSVYRYIKNIMIFVADEDDKADIESMGLGEYTIDVIPTNVDSKNRTTDLPRKSLLRLMHGFQELDGKLSLKQQAKLKQKHNNDETEAEGEGVNYFTQESIVPPEDIVTEQLKDRIRKFKYVFFTEGDQVVHCRNFKAIFDVINASDGHFALVPHRMQTFAMMVAYSKETHKYWPAVHAQQHLKDKVITVESLYRPRGSCCDAGRHKYAKCRGWWYNCIDWGLRNFTDFFTFGKNGLAITTSSEHSGVCTYSPARIQCPLPDDCTMSTPIRSEVYDSSAAVEQQQEEEVKPVKPASKTKKYSRAKVADRAAAGGGDDVLLNEQIEEELQSAKKTTKRVSAIDDDSVGAAGGRLHEEGASVVSSPTSAEKEAYAKQSLAKFKAKQAAAKKLRKNDDGAEKIAHELAGGEGDGEGEALEDGEEDADLRMQLKRQRAKRQKRAKQRGSKKRTQAASVTDDGTNQRRLAEAKFPIDLNKICKEMPIMKYFGPEEEVK